MNAAAWLLAGEPARIALIEGETRVDYATLRAGSIRNAAALLDAGLRPGDVIRSVNGRPIGSAADAAGLANQLTPGARLSLEVERGASVVPIALFLAKP